MHRHTPPRAALWAVAGLLAFVLLGGAGASALQDATAESPHPGSWIDELVALGHFELLAPACDVLGAILSVAQNTPGELGVSDNTILILRTLERAEAIVWMGTRWDPLENGVTAFDRYCKTV